jgi:protein O-mannosyl-transferase
MAKKIAKPLNQAHVSVQQLFEFPTRIKYTILAVICLVLYGNTLFNEYALDDNAVVLGNTYVQKGISGIPKILATDAWNSYLQQSNSKDVFTGGRYRPLSIIFFAIEQSLFGNSAFIRHLINIIFFIATVFLIFYFLSNFLLKKIPQGRDCAFISAVLFAIHPIHTEVVGNIKSFDEILSLFFILLTFIFSMEYRNQKKRKFLFLGIGSFFLALLSKEYAIMLILLLPLLFYLFPAENKKGIISNSIPYFITALVYLILRISVVGIPHSNAGIMHLSMNNQLRIDPYFLATPVQKFATEWYALGKYLFMLFVPYPLSCDYSYNQIPYHNFADISFWISMFAYFSIAYSGYKLLKQKHIMAFPVFLYLLMLLPISNFFINVGAVYGERFDYHASLAFVTIVPYFILNFTKKVSFQTKKMGITIGMAFLIFVCGGETMQRNLDWKNNYTLFMHDAKVAPNSEFIDDGASVAYINLAMEKGNESRKVQMLDSAIMLCGKGISLDKSFPDLYQNAGLAYYNLFNLDSAKYFWDIVKQSGIPDPKVRYYETLLAKTYSNKARQESSALAAIQDVRKGISEDSTIPDLWYILAGAYYHLQQFDSAEYALMKASEYKTDSTDAGTKVK